MLAYRLTSCYMFVDFPTVLYHLHVYLVRAAIYAISVLSSILESSCCLDIFCRVLDCFDISKY